MSLLLRFVLAIVFALAGTTKLSDLAGSRDAVRNFGVSPRLAHPLGLLLPAAELMIAIGLLFAETAWLAAIGALVLLSLFILGIAINLAQGRKPDCHCFGQLYSAPVGWHTLIRNGIFALIAGVVVITEPTNVGPGIMSMLPTFSPEKVIAVGFATIVVSLLVLEGWFIVHLMRQNGRLLLRMDALETLLSSGHPVAPAAPISMGRGLPVGSPAPSFALTGLYGETLTLDALRTHHNPLLLVFSDPGCGPCNTLLPDIGRWQREYAGRLDIALISRGTPDANRTKSAEHGLSHVLLQKDREVAQAYQVNGTPGAVLIRPDGTIGRSLVMGVPAISALIAELSRGSLIAPALPTTSAPARSGNGANANGQAVGSTVIKIGDRAPGISLPDLEGNRVHLRDFRGTNTLVLFWNPGCGFCRRMLEELRTWEENAPEGAPKLLVVSTGSVEANKALGLTSTVVLETSFSVGRRFGASGTPSAVLVDAKGKIASEVVVGAPAVLALAQITHDQEESPLVKSSLN